MHRPSLPYKFKFKFSGLPERLRQLDPALGHGDQSALARQHPHRRELARDWYAAHGMEELIDNVVTRCPTKRFAYGGRTARRRPRTCRA